MIIVTVRRQKAPKIRNRYGWVFADELVDIQADRDLGIANVFEENGGFLGKGLFLKGASKTVRMLTLRDEEIDEPFFLRRFRRALSVRTRINPNVAYRLINAESEGLPGLIVDRYGDYLVAQIRHPALEEKKPQIISALLELYEGGIRGIFERSDFESTPEYRLNRHSGVLWGEVPEETTVWVDGIAYLIRFKTGQKTGLFLDQQASRAKARQLIRTYHLEGQPALDLFCYTGGFSFTMAQEGMTTLGVDKSAPDIETAQRMAEINGLTGQTGFIVDDVFSWLLNQTMEKPPLGKPYGLIVIDPPSLIKSQQERPYGKRLLTELVRSVLPLLAPNGLICLCSCSYHLGWEEMIESVRRASADCGKAVIVVDQNVQSPDHPWLLQMPETLYLKCLWMTVPVEGETERR